jgi:hypothetical protein
LPLILAKPSPLCESLDDLTSWRGFVAELNYSRRVPLAGDCPSGLLLRLALNLRGCGSPGDDGDDDDSRPCVWSEPVGVERPGAQPVVLLVSDDGVNDDIHPCPLPAGHREIHARRQVGVSIIIVIIIIIIIIRVAAVVVVVVVTVGGGRR